MGVKGALDAYCNSNKCYLCDTVQTTNDFTIKCQYNECDKAFHAVCGLFGDCYLLAHKSQKNAMFEFKFYCKTHKYLVFEHDDGKKMEIKFDNLGQHLVNIKKLQSKLDKIKLTADRVEEYELTQRGIISHSTNSYKECGNVRLKKKKHRKRKNKEKYEYDESEDSLMTDISMDSVSRRHRSKPRSFKTRKSSKSRLKKKRKRSAKEFETESNILSEHQNQSVSDFEEQEFTMRKTRSSSKKQKPKQNAANVEKNVYKKTKKIEQIRMATDIWAEQYQYGGGEIKWPVIKRNGWFMAIPRLKLPKGNKFRYSHKERKAKQELIQKEKEKKTQKIEMIKEKEQEIESVVGGNNVQWDMFMDAINAKEAELAQSEMKEQSKNKNVKKKKKKTDKNKNMAKYNKYKTGGENWEFVETMPPVLVDAGECRICPLCKKTKHANVSKPNWQKHLHAKHQFKCKKCKLMFTRHPILIKHLEQCNV